MTRPKAAGETLTERKRQAILTAAADLFLRHGYSGASMDQVAARAEVSKQTIYAQFAGKEALFVAMVQGMIDPVGDQVQQGMPDPAAGTGLTEHLVAYAVRQLEVARNPSLMRLRRLVIAEGERFPELGRAVYERGPGRAIAGLATAFARWHGLGWLQAPDPRVAATHFNWLIMGEPVNRAMLLSDDAAPSPAALARYAKEAVRVFMAGYGPGARGA